MAIDWFVWMVVGLLGLVIGSFLNVVIYRLHTGRSLNDRSHCLSCGQGLAWYELFPVFSYLVLRGRCRHCSSAIPYRYVLVELLTAGAFLLVYQQAPGWIEFILLAALVSTLLVGLVYDWYHLIIPDEISLGTALLAGLLVWRQAATTEEWGILLDSLMAALIASLVYASLWYFSAGRAFGLGDAKLVFGLAWLVGLPGLFSLLVWSFWLGALVGLIMILLSTNRFWSRQFPKLGRVKMKSEVPFAPFLVASFVLVYFFKVDILNLVETALFPLL